MVFDSITVEEEYTTRYTAFVDILGFSELVNQSVSNREIFEILSNALDELQIIRPTQHEDTGLLATTFSDNILLSANDTFYGLEHLIFSIEYLSRSLLVNGILLRGGIARGLLFHSPTKVFGPAVARAVSLEGNVAEFPRTIVDLDVLEQVGALIDVDNPLNDRAHHLISSAMRQDDNDGCYYIHYLSLYHTFHFNSDAEDNGHSLLATSRRISDMLQDKLVNIAVQPRVWRKYRWLAEYWNSICSNGPSGGRRIRFPADARRGFAPVPWRNTLGNERDDVT